MDQPDVRMSFSDFKHALALLPTSPPPWTSSRNWHSIHPLEFVLFGLEACTSTPTQSRLSGILCEMPGLLTTFQQHPRQLRFAILACEPILRASKLHETEEAVQINTQKHILHALSKLHHNLANDPATRHILIPALHHVLMLAPLHVLPASADADNFHAMMADLETLELPVSEQFADPALLQSTFVELLAKVSGPKAIDAYINVVLAAMRETDSDKKLLELIDVISPPFVSGLDAAESILELCEVVACKTGEFRAATQLMERVLATFLSFALESREPATVLSNLCAFLSLEFEAGHHVDNMISTRLTNIVSQGFGLNQDMVLNRILTFARLAHGLPSHRVNHVLTNVLPCVPQAAKKLLGARFQPSPLPEIVANEPVSHDVKVIAEDRISGEFVVIAPSPTPPEGDVAAGIGMRQALNEQMTPHPMNQVIEEIVVSLVHEAALSVERRRHQRRIALSRIVAGLLDLGSTILSRTGCDLGSVYKHFLPLSLEPAQAWILEDQDTFVTVVEASLVFVSKGISNGHNWLKMSQSLDLLIHHVANLPLGPRDDDARVEILLGLFDTLDAVLVKGDAASPLLSHGLDVIFVCLGGIPGTETAASRMMVEGTPSLRGSDEASVIAATVAAEPPTPKPADVIKNDILKLTAALVKKFTTARELPMLLRMGISLAFFTRHFAPIDGMSQIRSLFRAVISGGRHMDAKSLADLCKEDFIPQANEAVPLHGLRKYLYGLGTTFTSQQLRALCEIMVDLVLLRKPLFVDDDEEGTEDRVADAEAMVPALSTISRYLVSRIEHELAQGKFTKPFFTEIKQHIGRARLFRTFFASKLQSMASHDASEVEEAFRSAFPNECIEDAETMEQIQVICERVQHTRQKYAAIQRMSVAAIRLFLGGPNGQTLKTRLEALEAWVSNQPVNLNERKRLVQTCGYDPLLWEKDVRVSVVSDGSTDPDATFKRALLTVYSGYLPLLRQLGERAIVIDSRSIPLGDLFSGEDVDECSVADLRGRRAAVIRVIDDRTRNKESAYSTLIDQRFTLLAREDQLEMEIEKQQKTPRKPRKFTCVVQKGFMGAASGSRSNIVGCYAPNGIHCEKPLEIGLRSNCLVLSIMDDGVEIENVEALCTDQGLFLFRAYSNGHIFDVSEVWLAMIIRLVEERLVPAVIVSGGWPNPTTFARLSRHLHTELSSSLLSFNDAFFNESETYYDVRPRIIRAHRDIFVSFEHLGLLVEGGKQPEVDVEKCARLNLDLPGHLLTVLLKAIGEDDGMKQMRQLGPVLSLFIQDLVTTGLPHPEIIDGGFDLDRWNRTHPPLDLAGKAGLVHKIALCACGIGTKFVKEVDVDSLLEANKYHFFQLRAWIKARLSHSSIKGKLVLPIGLARRQARCIEDVLRHRLQCCPIGALSPNEQTEVMRWVFKNEDRVWRYRGGRDGRETVDQFLTFLLPPGTAFPGVIARIVPRTSRALKLDDVVGYVVGEFVPGVAPSYEIVAAFVDTRWRHLHVASGLYLWAAKESYRRRGCRRLVCDVLSGSLQRVIRGSMVFQLMVMCGLEKKVVLALDESYLVSSENGSEQFERLVLDLKILGPVSKGALFVMSGWNWLRWHRRGVGSVMMAAVLTGVAVAWRRR